MSSARRSARLARCAGGGTERDGVADVGGDDWRDRDRAHEAFLAVDREDRPRAVLGPRERLAFGFEIGGVTIAYEADTQTITCQDKSAPLPPEDNAIRLRVLVDRGSLEIFGNRGAVCTVIAVDPTDTPPTLAVFARNGTIKLSSLEVHEVKAIWPATGRASA